MSMFLIEEDNIIAGFSDKNDGDLALYQFAEDRARECWQNLEVVKNLDLQDPVFSQQVHGHEVLCLDNRPQQLCHGRADALITGLCDVPVGVFTADCLPLLFWNPAAVAAVHAGWRGSCQNIAAATVAAFKKHHKIAPDQLKVAIGPSIGACCLELGEEVFWQFIEADSNYQQFFLRKHKWHLDLVELNRFQLLKAGVKPEKIMVSHQCTFCNEEKFYSFRRQKKRNGSMFSFAVRRGAN